MGRGNYSYGRDSVEVYVDLKVYEAAEEAEKDWDARDTGYEYDRERAAADLWEMYSQDLKDNLESVAGPSFSRIDEWENECHFILEGTFVDIGLADNQSTTAIVFRPHEREDGEADRRAIPTINRIVNELMTMYELYGASGAWTSYKLEGKFTA